MKTTDALIERGQIWYVSAKNTTPTGSEIWSNRPALIVSNDGTNQNADFVNIVYLTTQTKRKMPYHVTIISNGKEAIALCEQIFAADKSRLVNLMGKASEDEMLRIDSALSFSLGITSNPKLNDFFQKWVNYINRYNINLSGNPLDKELINDKDTPALYKKLCDAQARTIDSLQETIATQNALLRGQAENSKEKCLT